MTCLQLANQIGLFFSSTTHCELTFIVPMPQSGCFIIQLPRRVLRVYWLGYLPGSVFRERVSGASSLVCTGLYVLMPFASSICFERVSYIEYLSNVVCNGQEVRSVVVSRGVCYCTEFDLVSSFFAPRLSVVFAIVGMLHGFLM